MDKRSSKFESGHPDTEPAPSAGSLKSWLAHFGALGGFENLDFVVENQNQIQEQMIKSVTLRTANGDVNKRWYVEYQEYNSLTSSWLRKREYGFVNKEKDPVKKLEKLNVLYNEILRSLSDKFIPVTSNENSIRKYVNMYIATKANELEPTSIKNIKLTLKCFVGFLAERGQANIQLHQVTKDHIQEFKRALSKLQGNRSVNNHLDFLKAFFNHYLNNFEDLLLKNPVKGIDKLQNKSESHVAYTQEQTDKIFEYLARHDQQLLLFCLFVGIGFVRCKEAKLLKVGDLDFKGGKIMMPAGIHKTGVRMNKPMLKVFIEVLKARGIDKYPPHFYIFSIEGKPGPRKVHYNYFQKRFKKVKDEYGLTRHHTLYGFRHTYVCQMLESGAKWIEAMKYTGHTTMEAFSKYAKSLMNKPAEDLSGFVNVSVK